MSDSRITITVTANETLGTNPTILTGAVTAVTAVKDKDDWRSRIDRLSVTC